MKRQTLTRLLVAGLFATAASLASAQSADMSLSAQADARTQPTSQSTNSGSEYGATVASEGNAKPAIDRNCLQTTGTHIRPRHRADQRCVAATGRVYSREDLDSTGRVHIAEALRTLDPSIR